MFYGRRNLIRLYMTDYFIFFGVHLSFKVTNFDEKRGLPVLILEIFLFQRHESKFSVPVWLVPSHTNYKTIKKCLWSMKSIKRQRNLKSTVKSCSPSEKQTSSPLCVFKTFQYRLLLEVVISLHFTSSSVYNTPTKHDSVNVFVWALLKEDDRKEIFEAI